MDALMNPHLGEPNAFIAEHTKLMHWIASKYRHSAEEKGFDYSELESAGMLALWKAYQTFDPTQMATWSTYAVRCLHNEMKMIMRKKRPNTFPLDQPVAEDEDGGSFTISHVISGGSLDDTAIVVEDFMRSLSDRDREILELRLSGLKNREIGERLGFVQSYISRILARIGKSYQKGEFKVARTIGGDLEAAKQLIAETNFDNLTISNQTGVSVNRVRLLRIEMSSEQKQDEKPRDVTSCVESMKDSTAPAVKRPDSQEMNTESILDRLEKLRCKFTECLNEISEIEKEVRPLLEAKIEMSEVARKLLALVG